MGDQQEGDKFTAEPCDCHRCFAARKDYLVPDALAQVKSSKHMRLRVELPLKQLPLAHNATHLKGAQTSGS